jgi:hypothetical protein
MADMTVDDGGGREKRVRVDYPSNSKKGQQPKADGTKPPVERVVVGDVVTRKQSTAGKFLHNLVAEDGQSVVQYVVMEVLLPAAKNAISDAVSQGVERMLFGDSRPRPASGNRPGYTNYSRFGSGRAVQEVRPELSRQARATHDFNDIIIGSRAEAEDVLDRLRDLISTYDVATVSDLYDLVGLTGEFTDDKWGWLDLRSASVRAIRGGYLLHLPKTQPIV